MRVFEVQLQLKSCRRRELNQTMVTEFRTSVTHISSLHLSPLLSIRGSPAGQSIVCHTSQSQYNGDDQVRKDFDVGRITSTL